MTGQAHARITVHAGEADRADGRFLADALLDRFDDAALDCAVLLRCTSGFGVRSGLRTDQLLTLSIDLPILAIGMGERTLVDSLAASIEDLGPVGLVTIEPLIWDGEWSASPNSAVISSAALVGQEQRLTVVVGSKPKVDGISPHVAIVDALRQAGIAGATALCGVDGLRAGKRLRASIMAPTAEVPVVIISFGSTEAIRAASDQIKTSAPGAVLSYGPVTVCKRDGQLLEPPPSTSTWQRLSVYHGEQSRSRGRSLSAQLIPTLRGAGVAGATSLRGIWGYHGDHTPHGDRLLSLRRRVPVMTTVVERGDGIAAAWDVIDDFTDESGLVTSEPLETVRSRAGHR